ncbi:hypothetical protein ACO2Q0_20160 [Phenylobacterium sp. VNQ135]|uniref:hypothetical protein n=1 Tax=Phenylobacterium sp. VNQ135 TaxID=3400922 RepID=UPI003C0285B7
MKLMERPHIGLSYLDSLPPEFFEDFQRELRTDGLRLRVDARPATPFAGVEWLLPTAVMLFLGKAYFEGFLAELGKDHYVAVKQAVHRLNDRLKSLRFTLVGSPGKVADVQRYSHAFSIWVEGPAERTFKFLLPADLASPTTDAALDVCLEFVRRYYQGDLQPIVYIHLAETQAFGRTVLLAMNPADGSLQLVHPITREHAPLPPIA